MPVQPLSDVSALPAAATVPAAAPDFTAAACVSEAMRLAALARLDILDSAPEPEFDALVQAAALACDVPIALIGLIDHERQWFKAHVGTGEQRETPRGMSFCTHAIGGTVLMEVPDTTRDVRFAAHPLVTGAPHLRFYAGMPLCLQGGAVVGTLCVFDLRPRQLDDRQRAILAHLAGAVAVALEKRRAAQADADGQARIRAFSDSSPFGIFAADALGQLTYANPRWTALCGLSQNASLGRGWLDAVHLSDRATAAVAWAEAVAGAAECTMVFRAAMSGSGDGERFLRLVSNPVPPSNRMAAARVGSLEDVTEHLLSQRALDEDRQRLVSILDATRAGTWEYNLQTGELRVNDAWARTLGFAPGECAFTVIGDCIARTHPGDLRLARRALARHLAGGTTLYEAELRLRHRDGHWVWVHDRGQLQTRSADGRPEWIFGTHTDISARKGQEEALRHSVQLLDRTGAVAGVGGWELDLVTGVLHWSDETCRIHGLPPGYRPQVEEAIGFYAPEARPVLRAVIERAAVLGEDWDLEMPMLRPDGQALWVRVAGSAERDGGMPVRIYGAVQDITAQVAQRRALEQAHQRIALATEHGGIGVWEYECDADMLHWDARMCGQYGLDATDYRGPAAPWHDRLHPDDRTAAQAAWADAVAGRQPLDTEFRVVHPDGGVRFLRTTARRVADGKTGALRLVGVGWDVTPVRALSAELAEQHELLRVTLQSIGDAVITTDAQAHVTWLNPVAERMTGWTRAEACGLPLDRVFQVVDAATGAPVPHPVAACLQEDRVVELAGASVLRGRGGQEFGIEDSAAPIRSEQGRVLGAVLVFHDVTEQRRISGEMTYRATHDALTGLVNRAEFEARLQHTLQAAQADGSRHVLCYLDLDQFKLVNDACGHAAGDQLLQMVGRLLVDTVRARDTVARLGGDEFGILLERCTAEQAVRVGQKICDRMEEFRFQHQDRRFRIGASIGLVPVDDRWKTLAAVLQAADTSCYAAKEAGRNRVHVWFDSDAALQARHGEMQWTARIEQALDDDRFVLFAQRIFRPGAPPDAPLHAEILLRMQAEDGSLVQPGAFLPAAERFHLCSRIDRWVLRATTGLLSARGDLAAIGTLCVNLSGQSIGDPAFHRFAIDLLQRAGPAVCRTLCLEITETAAITNILDAAAFIEQVRELQVRIALDDFGAGASSFGYLKNLGVDMLKIDGQFITHVVDDPLDEAAVRCFVDVARVVGVRTVAEFVDDRAVLDRVVELGVDYVQGFFLHRPAPVAEVLGGVAVPA